MHPLLSRLSDSLPWLDKPATILKQVTEPVLGPEAPYALKDVLYGTWLGHPLHPLMTDISIGGWTMSMACDLLGLEEASDITLKLGTISAVGTALTGAAQWFDLQEMEEPRRLGALHATLNTAALGLYLTSWMLRDHGHRGSGLATAWTGYALSTSSAWIGGHLSFSLGIGVSREAFREPVAEWTDVATFEDVPDGELTRVETDGGPIVLLREGSTLHAASATCTHVGGPLDEGERHGTCVTCPWHASEFDLRDGRVIHGPATSRIHAYETRVEGGKVQIRSRPA